MVIFIDLVEEAVEGIFFSLPILLSINTEGRKEVVEVSMVMVFDTSKTNGIGSGPAASVVLLLFC